MTPKFNTKKQKENVKFSFTLVLKLDFEITVQGLRCNNLDALFNAFLLNSSEEHLPFFIELKT
jgi:hypothetical protein